MSGVDAGALAAAAGLAGLLLAPGRAARCASFALFVVGVVVAGGDLLHSPIATLRVDASRHPPLAAAGLLAGAAALAVSAVLARRFPTLLLVAIVAAAPARIPFHAGGQRANLLIFLYALIAVMVVVQAYELLVGRERAPRMGAVGWAAAALIVWSAVSLLWTSDAHQGGVEMLFFYLPFGYLLSRLAATRPTGRQLTLMLGTQVALGLVFAAVAFWQEATHHIFWNQGEVVGNQYASFFRVNSLFYDASIYGRFMAVTITLLLAVVVFRRMDWRLITLMAVLFAAQYFSYSQSSMVALAAGALVIGASVWPRRALLALAIAGIAVGLAGAAVWVHGRSARDVTSGRSVLLQDGWRVVRHHPASGAGLGGFARSAVHGTAHPGRVKRAASHTTPVTVVAELGPLGLALYLALLAAIARLAAMAGSDRALRIGLAAGLAAIFASSLFYNAYFEDPASWILTALIVAVSMLPAERLREAAA